MATVTSRRAKLDAKLLARRRELAQERIEVERKLAPHETRAKELDAELKKIATEAGESFTETFERKGDVKVAGVVAAESKGEQPVLQTEAWLKLSEIERRRLVKSGLIALEQQWGRGSSGRVTVNLFKPKGKAA